MLQEQRFQIYDRINNIKTQVSEIGKDKQEQRLNTIETEVTEISQELGQDIYQSNRDYRDRTIDLQEEQWLQRQDRRYTIRTEIKEIGQEIYRRNSGYKDGTGGILYGTKITEIRQNITVGTLITEIGQEVYYMNRD